MCGFMYYQLVQRKDTSAIEFISYYVNGMNKILSCFFKFLFFMHLDLFNFLNVFLRLLLL